MAIPVMRWIGDRLLSPYVGRKKEVKQKSEKLTSGRIRTVHIQMGWWKIWCSEQIFRYLPEGKRLIEPFVGGELSS